jgi:hypothetical protein
MPDGECLMVGAGALIGGLSAARGAALDPAAVVF